ncbi:galectin-related protein A-like [Corythoichthys intestinalis]|uniref:galectin-related protein A-like n=1 Tax=Corythoichthys intestinalis TaxID=161448 RepID=UPI0025A529D4|nr:galectin-related protein A-like [Corythoichthys intestinalis]
MVEAVSMATGGVCRWMIIHHPPHLASLLQNATVLRHTLTRMEDKDKKGNEEYIGEIKGGLRPSMKLVVMGIVDKKPKSIEVVVSSAPLQKEADEDDEQDKAQSEGDVGLQLKVSFLDKAVQRNARLAGKWGPAENTLSFFPFAPGEPFKLEIVCEHQQFRILVDGQPLCGFAHRLPQLASLTALRVFGDVRLTKVA